MKRSVVLPVNDYWVPLVSGLGVVALAYRTSGYGSLVVMGSVGVAALLLAAGPRSIESQLKWVVVTGFGITAFLAVRLFGTAPTAPALFGPVAAAVVAGIVEEALLRRAIFGWLMRFGVLVAVGVPAAAFAIMHIPGYGPSVLAINFAAGCLLGWQRWASGSWTSPAFTHVVANLLAYRWLA